MYASFAAWSWQAVFSQRDHPGAMPVQWCEASAMDLCVSAVEVLLCELVGDEFLDLFSCVPLCSISAQRSLQGSLVGLHLGGVIVFVLGVRFFNGLILRLTDY